MNKDDIYFKVYDKIKKCVSDVMQVDYESSEVYIYDSGNKKNARWRNFIDVTIIEKSTMPDSDGRELFTGDLVKSQLGYMMITHKTKMNQIANVSPIEGETFKFFGSIFDDDFLKEAYGIPWFSSFVTYAKEARGEENA